MRWPLVRLLLLAAAVSACDSDVFCAPDFGDFGASTIVGILLAVLGNVINSAGYILQKIGYKRLLEKQEKYDEEQQKQQEQQAEKQEQQGVEQEQQEQEDGGPSILKEPIWIIGFVTYGVGSLTIGAALGFAPSAMIVPLEGVTLICNAFFAPMFLGEKLGKTDIYGSAICFVGIIITVCFGPSADEEYTIDDLLELWYSVQNIVYACFQISMGIAAYVWLKGVQRLNNQEGVVYDGNDGAMKLPRAKLSANLHTVIAGVFAAFNVLFLKVVSTTFISSDEPAADRFASPWPYIFLVAMVCCNVTMESWKQKSLQQFESVYIVPIFQATLIVLAVVTGGVYFKEFNELKPINLVIFGLGLGTVAAGVYVLALETETKLQRILRTKVLTAIRMIRAFQGKVAPDDGGNVPETVKMPGIGLPFGGKQCSRANSRACSRRHTPRPETAEVTITPNDLTAKHPEKDPEKADGSELPADRAGDYIINEESHQTPQEHSPPRALPPLENTPETPSLAESSRNGNEN